MKSHKLLPLLLIPFISYCQSNGSWDEYNKNGSAIKYLSRYSINDIGRNTSEFLFIREKNTKSKDFVDNIKLIIKHLETLGINLDEFVSISQNQFKDKASHLESSRINLNLVEYHRLVYESKIKNIRLKFLQYYFLINKKLTYIPILQSLVNMAYLYSK